MELAPHASPTASSHGLIVVVDDDVVLLRGLTRRLTRTGYEVAAFASAEEALDAIAVRAAEVDAIISDRQMPSMDGIAMLHHVRARWPDIPFIVLTGDASPASAIEAMRQGAYDYLSK